jgi:hypothetical protein
MNNKENDLRYIVNDIFCKIDDISSHPKSERFFMDLYKLANKFKVESKFNLENSKKFFSFCKTLECGYLKIDYISSLRGICVFVENSCPNIDNVVKYCTIFNPFFSKEPYFSYDELPRQVRCHKKLY